MANDPMEKLDDALAKLAEAHAAAGEASRRAVIWRQELQVELEEAREAFNAEVSQHEATRAENTALKAALRAIVAPDAQRDVQRWMATLQAARTLVEEYW